MVERCNLVGKKLLNKSTFCGQEAPIVRISSLVYDLINYYSVTDNIIQLIVDFGFGISS